MLALQPSVTSELKKTKADQDLTFSTRWVRRQLMWFYSPVAVSGRSYLDTDGSHPGCTSESPRKLSKTAEWKKKYNKIKVNKNFKFKRIAKCPDQLKWEDEGQISVFFMLPHWVVLTRSLVTPLPFGESCMKAISRELCFLLNSTRKREFYKKAQLCFLQRRSLLFERCWFSVVTRSAGWKGGSPCLGRAGTFSGSGSCLQPQRTPRRPWAPWSHMLTPDLLHSED